MLKKIFCIVAVLIICISSVLCVNSSALTIDQSNSEIQLMYTNVQTVTSTLSISSRTASCKSYVKGISGTTKILVIQKLQKKSGNSWATVQTWSKTFDSIVASVTNTKSSLASGTYRIRTTAKVYCGSNYETINVNSATKTC